MKKRRDRKTLQDKDEKKEIGGEQISLIGVISGSSSSSTAIVVFVVRPTYC